MLGNATLPKLIAKPGWYILAEKYVITHSCVQFWGILGVPATVCVS